MPVAVSERVVEVIADLGQGAERRYQYGSGCIVRGRTVLTAAHILAGAQAVQIRRLDKRLRAARVDRKFVGGGIGPDLALIDIDDEEISLDPIELGMVVRESPVAAPIEACHAVGYPWFAETPSPSAVRDTVDAWGHIPLLSKLAAGLLTVQVTSSPRPLPPERIALGESGGPGCRGLPSRKRLSARGGVQARTQGRRVGDHRSAAQCTGIRPCTSGLGTWPEERK